MDILRNLPVQQPAALSELISIQPGRVVSMALSRSEHCQMTLLALGTERVSVRSATSATRSIMCWRVICLCAWRGTRFVWAQGIVWLCQRRPPTLLAGTAPSNCCKLPSNQTEEDLYGTVDQKPAPCPALSPEGSGRVQPGKVVSLTLAQRPGVGMTLFAF